jgi:peptidoglycan/LPS O-acetylase OafA/YrhL
MKYRSDIDGLRAVAILPVVLFHAEIAPFSGGFVGVDVFFVISGFLITGLILGDMDAGTFSFPGFWLRRVRRILPALFVLMAFAAIAFAFVYPPDYYRQFAGSLVAQSVFLSNVLFWREAGYFDAWADTKPLLHTWSLSVEEQFYLFIPILLFVLVRYARRFTWLAFAVIIALSLALAVWASLYEPVAGFFLLPTRAYELSIGSLLAIAVLYHRNALRLPALDNALGVLGVVAIGCAVFAFDQNTPFPSYTALLPCLGTAAVIWSGRNGSTTIGRILSLRPIVFVGLISYSLYLWHWTLLVLNRAIWPGMPSLTSRIVAIAIGVVMAYLSYRFVETPIRRNRTAFPNRRLVVGAALGFGVLIAAGATIHKMHGLPQRFDDGLVTAYAEGKRMNPRRDECHRRFDQDRSRFMCLSPNLPVGETPPVVIWGDSHADALYPALEAASTRTGVPFAFASYPVCPPIPGLSVQNVPKTQLCEPFDEAMLAYILSNPVKAVILIARFNLYLDGNDSFTKGQTQNLVYDPAADKPITPANAIASMSAKYKALVRRLEARGVKIFVILQVPNMLADPPSHFFKTRLFGLGDDLVRSRKEFDLRSAPARAILRQPGVTVVDLAPLLCDDESCYNVAAGNPLYRDDHHLNIRGAMKTLPTLIDILSEIKSAARRR